MSDDLLTTKEAADFLGISPSTIYRMEEQGLITPFKTPGGQRRFSRSDLENYLRMSSEIQAPQNPSSFKNIGDSEQSEPIQEKDSGLGKQLSLFGEDKKPRISQRKHSRIWSHRHIDEDADYETLVDQIELDDPGEIHPKNDLNDLPGKEWIKFQSSWFLFNALAGDLKEERQATSNRSDQHPATYSPTMIGDFILFFTKPNQIVLDPFVGIGSTLVACDRTNRNGIGIELSPKYVKIARMRTHQPIIEGDARNIDQFDIPMIDYCITSPPYWDVLNRSTKDFRKTRKQNGFDSNYSEEEDDIGNIDSYEYFLEEMYLIFSKVHNKLKDKGYLTIIIKNVKKGGQLYTVAWDLAKKLGTLYTLKDEKIWVQDKVKLAPYGYPHAWVSNIHHHYCLIFRKE